MKAITTRWFMPRFIRFRYPMTLWQLIKWSWYRAEHYAVRFYVRLLARIWSLCDVELARVHSGSGFRIPWRRAWTMNDYWNAVPPYVKRKLK
jgi:hypothetical protein